MNIEHCKTWILSLMKYVNLTISNKNIKHYKTGILKIVKKIIAENSTWILITLHINIKHFTWILSTLHQY